MIDRKARNEVIKAFEEYLDDRITAFEFDERLQVIETKDSTVIQMIHAAWFHYDDCTDHKVQLSKPGWDFFQRLLLILRSDTVVSFSETKRWSWDHACALIALAVFIAAAFFVGWRLQLFLLAIPFGAISMLVSRYRQRISPELTTREIACAPFDSYSQIRWLRRQVPSFKKRKFRREIEGRKIRSAEAESFNRAYSYCVWLVFGPVVLLFQGLPSPVSSNFTLTKS